MLLDSLGEVDAPELASILVHEAFHVWQNQNRSTAWETNELDALTYPAGQEFVFRTRGEEAMWLAKALSSEDWYPAARQALMWREARISFLAPEHANLERRMETKEGLAEFVETCFLNTPPALSLEQAMSSSPRQWAYHSGAALAHLLKRAASDWQVKVMAGHSLDTLLTAEIGSLSDPPRSHDDVRAAAHAAALANAGKLKQLEADFYAQEGQFLRLVSASGLAVKGFDPMNIHALGGSRVLHSRYLHLNSTEADIEIMGAQTLTTGPGLIKVTELDIRHLAEPAVQDGWWTVKTASLAIRIGAQHVQETPEGWLVTLP